MKIQCPTCKAVAAMLASLTPSHVTEYSKCRTCKDSGFIEKKTISFHHKPRSAMTGPEWLEADYQQEHERYLLETTYE